jgi:hypothetical protein
VEKLSEGIRTFFDDSRKLRTRGETAARASAA